MLLPVHPWEFAHLRDREPVATLKPAVDGRVSEEDGALPGETVRAPHSQKGTTTGTAIDELCGAVQQGRAVVAADPSLRVVALPLRHRASRSPRRGPAGFWPGWR